VGNDTRNGGQNNKDINSRDQAVVLTLRKRYSAAGGGRSRDRRERSTQRQSEWDSGGAGTASGLTTSVDPITVIDPWQDPSTSTSHTPQRRQTNRTHTLAHRLSYDPASGVIILPDEAEWLDSDDSDVVEADSDGEDYGAELERSVSSLPPVGDGEELGVGRLVSGSPERSSIAGASNQGMSPAQLRGSGVSTPTRTSRYGTYFHHPEKRKQTIPGAFPFR